MIEWNQILQDTIPGAGGVMAPRFFSMVHIAMFDAINAIEREFDPYHVRLRDRGRGSPEAAAAQAAHDVLVALNPPATAVYDAALARQLGSKPSDFVRRGAAVGARVATEVLAWRQNDGWIVSPSSRRMSSRCCRGAGSRRRRTIPIAAFTHLQNAAPMALLSPTQYLPPPPPSLTSERYATDLERGAAPRQVGQRRPHAGPDDDCAAVGGRRDDRHRHGHAIPRHLEQRRARRGARAPAVARRDRAGVRARERLDSRRPADDADEQVRVWSLAPGDGDPGGGHGPQPRRPTPTPTWLPLLTTPPYPSYAGNMASIGASAARALQLAFGTNDVPVKATWRQSGGLPDVTHEFDGFWELAEEQNMARIYGGIHYRFDQVAGQQIGRQTAEFVFANFMTPRGRWDD